MRAGRRWRSPPAVALGGRCVGALGVGGHLDLACEQVHSAPLLLPSVLIGEPLALQHAHNEARVLTRLCWVCRSPRDGIEPCVHREEQGNRQKHACKAPDVAEEGQAKEDNHAVDLLGGSEHNRLHKVSNVEMQEELRSESRDDLKERLPNVQQCKNARQDGHDRPADVRDKVGKEGQEAPSGGQLQPDDRQRDAVGDAHHERDKRLQFEIQLHGLEDALHHWREVTLHG
mmetsp:Transcript_26632/g.58098  ORF Transcript_26632/g.58098 Transcript_26632/m.58098 type:complete len:230 (+) Transcript_26632:185-874(+)